MALQVSNDIFPEKNKTKRFTPYNPCTLLWRVFAKLFKDFFPFCPFSIVVNGEFIKYGTSCKRLVVEQNGPKFGPQGLVFSGYTILLTIKYLRSV